MYACEHIFAGFEHMLTNMKRTTFPNRKLPKLPIAWSEAEYAAKRASAADTFGVSEDFFDVEDEHAEVDIIVQRMISGAN